MHIYAISCQKGGVGKTTTAGALLAGLTKAGRKVLAIELDPQGNLSDALNVRPKADLLEILQGKQPPADAIVNTNIGDIIPASQTLVYADFTLNQQIYSLKKVIEQIPPIYENIIIDTPPHLGALTLNALTACNSVIIPVQAEKFSIKAVIQISETINQVRKYNEDLKIEGLLITRYNPRATLAREAKAQLEGASFALGTKVYKSTIREATAIKEAQTVGVNIFDYAPKAKVTDDYLNFVKEVLENG